MRQVFPLGHRLARLQLAITPQPGPAYPRLLHSMDEHRDKRVKMNASEQAIASDAILETVANIDQDHEMAAAAGEAPVALRGAPQNIATVAASPSLPLPPLILKPNIPTDAEAWARAVLLVDKPQGWTSFDVCGKLRAAVAGAFGLRNKSVKVGREQSCLSVLQYGPGVDLGCRSNGHAGREQGTMQEMNVCPPGACTWTLSNHDHFRPRSHATRTHISPFPSRRLAMLAHSTPWPPASSSCVWARPPRA
jgi:hypothetical protein